MITKERLEELIGQYRELKKDLWWVNCWGVQKIDGYNFGVFYNEFAGHWQISWNNPENEHKVADIEDIFETKEDAEEYAEFGNITRTEKLDLPSWEEKLQCAIIIYGTQKNEYNKHCFEYELLVSKNEIGVLQLYPESKEYFWKKKTQENYNEARRLCKKLFLGEEV